MKPSKVIVSRNGLVVIRLYGPCDDQRLADETRIANRREEQLYHGR